MKTIAIAIAALGFAATPAGSADAAPRRAETIRYDTSACFGFCPAYTVTVSSDGRGVFEGRGHVAAQGPQRFRVTPAQFADFARRLAVVRPRGERLVTPGNPQCRDHATDQITVDVRWSGGRRAPGHLAYYFGCGMGENRALRDALRSAPGALPIARFIGEPRAPR